MVGGGAKSGAGDNGGATLSSGEVGVTGGSESDNTGAGAVAAIGSVGACATLGSGTTCGIGALISTVCCDASATIFFLFDSIIKTISASTTTTPMIELTKINGFDPVSDSPIASVATTGDSAGDESIPIVSVPKVDVADGVVDVIPVEVVPVLVDAFGVVVVVVDFVDVDGVDETVGTVGGAGTVDVVDVVVGVLDVVERVVCANTVVPTINTVANIMLPRTCNALFVFIPLLN